MKIPNWLKLKNWSEIVHDWSVLYQGLNSVLEKTVSNPSAILYLICVMLIGGLAGAWMPLLLMDRQIGTDAFATYVFAILAPVLADILLDLDKLVRRVDTHTRIFIYFASVFSCALALIALFQDHTRLGYACAWLSTYIAIIVWAIVAHSMNRFDVPSSTSGSIGGEKATSEMLMGQGLQDNPENNGVSVDSAALKGAGLPENP